MGNVVCRFDWSDFGHLDNFPLHELFWKIWWWNVFGRKDDFMPRVWIPLCLACKCSFISCLEWNIFRIYAKCYLFKYMKVWHLFGDGISLEDKMTLMTHNHAMGLDSFMLSVLAFFHQLVGEICDYFQIYAKG